MRDFELYKAFYEASLKAVLCKVCDKIPEHPRTLACGHSFCLSCICGELDKAVSNAADPRCPNCNKIYDVAKSFVEPHGLAAVCHLARRTQEQNEKNKRNDEASKAQQNLQAAEREIFTPLDTGLVSLENASGVDHNQSTAGTLFELSPEEVAQAYKIMAGFERQDGDFSELLYLPWAFDAEPSPLVAEETGQQKRKQQVIDITHDPAEPWNTVVSSRSHRKSYCHRQTPCSTCDAFIKAFDPEADTQRVRKGCKLRPVELARKSKRVKT